MRHDETRHALHPANLLGTLRQIDEGELFARTAADSLARELIERSNEGEQIEAEDAIGDMEEIFAYLSDASLMVIADVFHGASLRLHTVADERKRDGRDLGIIEDCAVCLTYTAHVAERKAAGVL
jgi:hypothetical protein